MRVTQNLAFLKHVNKACIFNPTHRIIAIHADADTGRTEGMLHLLNRHRIAYIIPRKRKEHAQHSCFVTPNMYHRIHGLQHDVIVIDEYHTSTAVIFHLLKRLPAPTRLIFLSHIPQISLIESYFGEGSVHSINPDIPTPYPVKIQYQNSPFVLSQMAENFPFLRAMVFVHKQSCCNYYQRNTVIPGYRIFSIHGGIPEHVMDEFWGCCRDLSQRMIIFCTSFLDAKIIPGVDLVIDNCMQNTTMNGSTHCSVADQSTLIHRARKTGQTCPGTVIRMISEDQYYMLPQFSAVTPDEHDWSVTLMSLVRNKIDPPNIVTAQETLEQLVSHGCVTPNHDMITSIGYEAMRMRLSPLLDAIKVIQCWRNKQYRLHDRLIMILASLITHHHSTDRGNLFWVPNNRFGGSDELHHLMNVFFSSLLAHNMDQFAEQQHINKKHLISFQSMFRRVFWVLHPPVVKDPRLMLRILKATEVQHGIFHLYDAHIDMVRTCSNNYWMQTYGSYYYVPMNGDNVIMRIRRSSYPHDSMRQIIPVMSHNDIFILWLAPPTSLRMMRRTFTEMKHAHHTWSITRVARLEWKKKMDDVIAEIRDDVAFRPGFVGALDAADSFHKFIKLNSQ